MNYVILAAGGKGIRFGGSKQFHLLRGKPLFLWAVETFRAERKIDQILFAYPPEESETEYKKFASELKFVRGGDTRYESVRNGFEAILDADPNDAVLIHDVARPLLSSDLLRRVLETTSQSGAVVPALPVHETIKEVEMDQIKRTVPRHNLRLAQTPQGFLHGVLKSAYEKVNPSPEAFTDEAAMVECAGFPVRVIAGERSNIKVTEPDDLALVEFFLNRRGA